MILMSLLFFSSLAAPTITNPARPWADWTPEQVENLIDSLAQQPPFFV